MPSGRSIRVRSAAPTGRAISSRIVTMARLMACPPSSFASTRPLSSPPGLHQPDLGHLTAASGAADARLLGPAQDQLAVPGRRGGDVELQRLERPIQRAVDLEAVVSPELDLRR